MRRRKFLAAAASVTVGTLAAGSASAAEERPAEKRSQVYKCEECGAIFEVVEAGTAPVVHCGKPMKLLTEATEGEGAVKHVPVIEKTADGYKVKVGATAHPMLANHYIAWIELTADGKIYRQFLEVGKPPEAAFQVTAQQVSARAYCNLHSLWKNKA